MPTSPWTEAETIEAPELPSRQASKQRNDEFDDLEELPVEVPKIPQLVDVGRFFFGRHTAYCICCFKTPKVDILDLFVTIFLMP